MSDRTSKHNLWHIHKLLSAYFHKLFMIVMKIAYNLYEKQFNFILCFVIEITYT